MEIFLMAVSADIFDIINMVYYCTEHFIFFCRLGCFINIKQTPDPGNEFTDDLFLFFDMSDLIFQLSSFIINFRKPFFQYCAALTECFSIIYAGLESIKGTVKLRFYRSSCRLCIHSSGPGTCEAAVSGNRDGLHLPEALWRIPPWCSEGRWRCPLALLSG